MYDYEAGKHIPPSECKASCECTGNIGYYFSDYTYKTNKTTHKPYNYGKDYGHVRALTHTDVHSIILIHNL